MDPATAIGDSQLFAFGPQRSIILSIDVHDLEDFPFGILSGERKVFP